MHQIASLYKLLLMILFLISCAKIENNTQSSTTSITQTPLSIESSQIVPTSLLITKTPAINNFEILLTSNPDNVNAFSLLENPICKLPCWWNIIPGKTDWGNAKKVLQLLGESPILYKKYKEYSAYEVTYYVPESIYFLNLRLHINKNIIEFISINSFVEQSVINSKFKLYSPKSILEEYGFPSRIYLRTYISNSRSYSISFFYDEENFLILYGGDITSIDYQNTICLSIPNDTDNISIYSQSPELKTYIDFYSGEKKIFDIERYSWIPILEATGLTIVEFSKLILEDRDICFEVK